MPSKRSSDDASGHAYLQVAEAEGNRTPLTEVLGHNGFEDRAAHQDGYASSGSPVMIPSKATAAESSSELQCYLRLRPTTIGSVECHPFSGQWSHWDHESGRRQMGWL
jgi:hypothetical protein